MDRSSPCVCGDEAYISQIYLLAKKLIARHLLTVIEVHRDSTEKFKPYRFLVGDLCVCLRQAKIAPTVAGHSRARTY